MPIGFSGSACSAVTCPASREAERVSTVVSCMMSVSGVVG